MQPCEPTPVQYAVTLDDIHRTIATTISATQTLDTLHAVHTSDRRACFAAWQRTATLAAGMMRGMGLAEVELIQIPADGITRYGDWVMPMSWDLDHARLELLDQDYRPTEVLCDTDDEPNAVVLGCGPTPPDGIIGDLIAEEQVSTPADMRGKLLLTRKRPSACKLDASLAGAIGVVSDYHSNPDIDPTSTYWENVWSDDPTGWLQTARDGRLPGFSLSPATGRRLRERLARGGALRIRAVASSRFSIGELPLITGVIPGTDPNGPEFLVSAHLFEPGAHDNASGGTAVLEAARTLSSLIEQGRLERPAHTIRFMLQAECYGTVAWVHMRPETVRRTTGAITLDGVGKNTPLLIHDLPSCQQSDLPALIAEVLDLRFPTRTGCHMAPFDLGDNLLCDPAIGIPCTWLHTDGEPRHHHSSADTIDRIHVPSIVDAAIVTATAAHRGIARARPPAAKPRRVDGPIPKRSIVGPLTFENLSLERSLALGPAPRWWGPELATYWWIDGNRGVDEIRQLVAAEFPASNHDPARTLSRLTESGHVSWTH